VDHFHGYYFTKPILGWLGNTWANIQKLKGYKKDIALAALGNTCKAKARFGQFSRSKKAMRSRLSDDHERAKHTQIGNIPLSEFTEAFRRHVRQLNRLVFDNGQECRAFNADAREVIPKVKADVLYCDPPYVTEFGANDYESDLHFVEGLVTMWRGKRLSDDARRAFPSRTRYSRAAMKEMFGDLVGAARRNYGAILISYRDRAFPTRDEIKEMLAREWQNVRVNAIEVEYGIVPYEAKRGGKHAKELLFVATGPKSMVAAAGEGGTAEPFHTSFPVEFSLVDDETPSARAINVGETPSGDKEFSFILCHVGTNENGDHFTRQELEGRHQTAVNKKIDLKHSRDFRDIVGGIVASDFVEDEAGDHVECIGELYVADNENARLAYKLMKKGIIKQVSMECDCAEGECSVCGRRVKSKADYCIHLKKFKGAEFKGKPVYEILHGITFTGLGLLDRKGADEKARITQVAERMRGTAFRMPGRAGPAEGGKREGSGEEPARAAPGSELEKGGSEAMADKKEKDEAVDQAATKKQASGGSDAAREARTKELEAENQKLKARLAELQKELEALRAKEKAAADRARAEKLLQSLEKQGYRFADEDQRARELERLASLSDEAFEATEAAYRHIPVRSAEAPKKQEDEHEGESERTKAQAEAVAETKGKLRTDAGVKPLVVDDRKSSLEDRLKTGFMAAYHERVGKGV